MPTYLSNALRAQLKVQKVPYDLLDGPERLQSGPRVQTQIVLERDPVGDGWGPPRARLRNENAVLIMQRTIRMRFTVYAQSTHANAAALDHEDETDKLVEQLGLALYHVVKAQLKLELRFGQSAFLTKEQIEQLRMIDWPGRIYVMPFEFDVGIYNLDWKANKPERIIVGPEGIPVESTIDIGEEPGPPKGFPGSSTEIEEAP